MPEWWKHQVNSLYFNFLQQEQEHSELKPQCWQSENRFQCKFFMVKNLKKKWTDTDFHIQHKHEHNVIIVVLAEMFATLVWKPETEPQLTSALWNHVTW